MTDTYVSENTYGNLVDWIVNTIKITANQPNETLVTSDREIGNIVRSQLGLSCSIWSAHIRPHFTPEVAADPIRLQPDMARRANEAIGEILQEMIGGAVPSGGRKVLDLDAMDDDGVDFIDEEDDGNKPD